MSGSQKWSEGLQRFIPSWLQFGLSETEFGDKEITNSDMNREKDEQYYLAWEGEEVDESDYEEISEFHNRYDYLHTHTAGDMQLFRFKLMKALEAQSDDKGEPLPNVWFYQNCIPAEPDEVYIDEFHNSWFGDYRKLEYVYSYIEWLFPIQEKGMNYSSYPLSHEEIQIFRSDEELQKKLLKSYKLMLDFYGIKLLEPQEQQEMPQQQEPQKQQQLPIGEVCHADNWEERFENLNWNTHNNLRITRILKCLGILGLRQYQAPLVKFFLQETLVNKTLPRVKRSVLDYFIFAVLDEVKRNELIRFAFQHFEPKEQFMWCPENSKIFRKKKSNPENKYKKTTQHSDGLKNNNEHHEGTISEPVLGLNAGSEDQDDKSQSDSKEDAEVQKSGNKAGDKNVTIKAGTLHCTKAKQNQVPNDKTTDCATCKNPSEDTDTGTKSNKAMKNANVKIQDNDKAEDDVTANASTNAAQAPDSVHQTKSTKQADVLSDKTSDDPKSEN